MASGIAYIRELDLTYLEKRLIDKENWSAEQASESVRRYKNFLTLICKHSDTKFPPPSDIDEVWHNHILFTREYSRDCEAMFGKYLHHAPFVDHEEKAEKEMEEMFYRAAALYVQEFNENYSLELDVAAFW